MDEVIIDWISYVNKNDVNSYDELVDEIFIFWNKLSYELTILVQANLSFYILDKLNKNLTEYVIAHIYNLSIKKNVNKSIAETNILYTTLFNIGALWNIYSYWLLDTTEISLEDLISFVKLNLKGSVGMFETEKPNQ